METTLETRELANTDIGVLHSSGKEHYQEDRFFVKSARPRNFREMPFVLKKIFDETAEKVLSSTTTGGSTATVAVLTPDNILTTAHLGDSPAVLFLRNRHTGKVRSVELLAPHDSSNASEVERVKREGGMFTPGASPKLIGGSVDGNATFLSISRAFGDREFPGLSHTAEINVFDISYIAKPDEQIFLAVGTDGVISDAKNIDAKYFEIPLEEFLRRHPDASEQDIAERMAKIAGKHIDDNQTLLLTELKPGRTQDLILGVFDGHRNATVSTLACAHIGMEITRDRTRTGMKRA